jgi:hypothetical protein
VVVALAALVPPRPSVPPGAGNEAEKAIKPESKGAEDGAQGYIDAFGFDGHLDAPTVRRHDDDDGAAIPTIEQTHAVSRSACDRERVPAVSGKSSRDRQVVNRCPMVRAS